MSNYLPPYATNCVMLLMFLSIFACALANVTTLSRMVWAMARDGQLPASGWLARVSIHEVPANAIWTVAVIAALFTFWAKAEIVILGIGTLTMYIVYGIVIGAALWGSRGKLKTTDASSSLLPPEEAPVGCLPPHASPGIGLVRVSPALCIAALLWIAFLLAMISIPRSAWTNLVATSVAMAVGAIWYLRYRPKGPRA